MVGAGIVRRIDELGRIVIPKEMRRTMHLKEGDEMEILSSGDALTLRKYSTLESIMPIIRSSARLLAKQTEGTALFVDTRNVLTAEGKDKRNFQGAPISEKFADIIRKRQPQTLCGRDMANIFADREPIGECCYVEPVVVGGDLMGAALLMLGEKNEIARTYIGLCVELISAAML